MAWTEDFTSELEEKIKDLKPKAVAKKANQDKTALWLFGFIILLGVGLYFSWQSKNTPYFVQPYNNYSQNNWQDTYNQHAQEYQNYQQQYYQQPPQMGVEQRVDRLENAARKIWDRTKWNSDRLVLLTTVNNHNTVVIRNGLPRTELIYFNSDWTINRMPDRIYLDKNDQEFLRQFIRK